MTISPKAVVGGVVGLLGIIALTAGSSEANAATVPGAGGDGSTPAPSPQPHASGTGGWSNARLQALVECQTARLASPTMLRNVNNAGGAPVSMPTGTRLHITDVHPEIVGPTGSALFDVVLMDAPGATFGQMYLSPADVAACQPTSGSLSLARHRRTA